MPTIGSTRDRICPQCGNSFQARKPSQKRTYCSHSCAYAVNRRKIMSASFAPIAIAKRADARRGTSDSGGYVKRGGRHEHRVFTEARIGRPLLSSEIVHHRDENRRNNTPENLQIVSRAEHARIHFHGSIKK